MIKSNIIAALIGMTFFCGFLFLVMYYMRVKEPIIIGICLIVIAMLLYDFYLSIKQIMSDKAEREDEME